MSQIIHEQEVVIPVKIKRKGRFFSTSYNLNGIGEICEPIYDVTRVDDALACVFGAFLTKSEQKGYRYLPGFEFGYFIPRKIRKSIEENARDFANVYKTMTINPEHYEELGREVEIFEMIRRNKNLIQKSRRAV